MVKWTKKSERRANAVLIAGNGFTTSYVIDETADNDEPSQDGSDEDESEETTRKVRIRGRKKIIHLVATLDQKLKDYAAVVRELGDDFHARHDAVKDGIKTMSTTYLHKRQTDALQELLRKRNQAPRSNARMRQTGVHIQPRLEGKVPYSDVTLVNGHEDDLDKELHYRHALPYLPFGEEQRGAGTLPVPERDVLAARPYEEMTFSQKKGLLMADEERRWRMDWCWDNDFDLIKLDIKELDAKTFTVRCPDVVFECPES